MKKMYQAGLVLMLAVSAGGCAEQQIKPTTVICPLLGSALGAGIFAGGLEVDDEGGLAAGALIGAAAGYFLCQERN